MTPRSIGITNPPQTVKGKTMHDLFIHTAPVWETTDGVSYEIISAPTALEAIAVYLKTNIKSLQKSSIHLLDDYPCELQLTETTTDTIIFVCAERGNCYHPENEPSNDHLVLKAEPAEGCHSVKLIHPETQTTVRSSHCACGSLIVKPFHNRLVCSSDGKHIL